MAVFKGRFHHWPGAIVATASEGTTWAMPNIARLKMSAHHEVVRPGTLPTKVASHATSPTPPPGAKRPVAMSRGSTTVWTPFGHRIGIRAAIWVPTAKYSRRTIWSGRTGFNTQPTTSAARLAAIATATKIFARPGSDLKRGNAGILAAVYEG